MAQQYTLNQIMKHMPTIKEVELTVINLRVKSEDLTYAKYANWDYKKWKKISTLATANIRFVLSAIKSRSMKRRGNVQTVINTTIQQELRNTNRVE